jgi:DNA topoisomerase-1
MNLVIVESPTKTKSLSKYLGGEFEVLATMGHMVDLPKSKLGVEIKKSKKKYAFEPDYVLAEGKGKQVKLLADAAKKASKVILATDPDREGEAIAWHARTALEDQLKKHKVKFERVVFHSITKEAVLEAMSKPRELDMSLVDAQQARRVLDRLVGYKLSPLLWRKVRRGLSAGRVQSVAVRLIVDREREIEAFKPDEYWPIRVELKPDDRPTFWVELAKVNGKKTIVNNQKQAEEIETQLRQAQYKVDSVVKRERKAHARPPFKTSTLQQAAANVLGWSSKKTMSVAQKLYEQGNITYHRTDSLSLASSALDQIRAFINSEFGKEYLPDRPNFFKTSGKVVAQEAHEAIRPSQMDVGTNSFKGTGKMASDQEKLYGLIWRRTIACQMANAIYDHTKVTVEAKNKSQYQLSATGEIEKFDGWRKLYKKAKGEDEAVILPELSQGETLEFKKLTKEQKFTQPPARFNDASLVKELEARGIGRPSTYAPTIGTIIARNYVERRDRRFYPTSIGFAVTEFLVTNFPKEMAFEFTATMESQLDEIASGSLDWMEMLSGFWGEFETHIETVGETAQRVAVPTESTGEKCPDCKEGEVVIREGRFGKFYSCSRFPECKYTARYSEYVAEVVCPKDGGRIVVKKTRRGREFYGCENYPKCDWASWKRPQPGEVLEIEKPVKKGKKATSKSRKSSKSRAKK